MSHRVAVDTGGVDAANGCYPVAERLLQQLGGAGVGE